MVLFDPDLNGMSSFPSVDLPTFRKNAIQVCTQKFPDSVDNETYTYNNQHSLRSNTKGYGGKPHYTDSQNSDTTASSGRELYHLQFSL